MNFFDAAFPTPISASEFGLCDNGAEGRAYTDCANSASWIATVNNPGADEWMFTAIDKGVIADGTCVGKSRCDGMLTRSGQTLILVELKDHLKQWLPHAIQQLQDTITLFRATHPAEWVAFTKKRAYACNKRFPQFKFAQHEAMLHFFQKHRVRLHVEAIISLNAF
jgi:hypothetical protein